jgi:hypothetical protein
MELGLSSITQLPKKDLFAHRIFRLLYPQRGSLQLLLYGFARLLSRLEIDFCESLYTLGGPFPLA